MRSANTFSIGAFVFPSSIVALWMSLGSAFQGLFIMMLLDFLSGILVGAQKNRLSSDVAKKGAIGKILIVVIVVAAQAFQAIVGQMVTVPIVFGKQFDLGATVAIFFIVSELLSILEHCAEAGLPIPGWLVSVALKARPARATPEQIRELGGATIESIDTRKVMTAADGSTVEKISSGTEVTIKKDPTGSPVP